MTRATRHGLIWIGVLAVFIVLLNFFEAILLPFVLGALIAYLLDPLADRLEAVRCPRWLATLLALLAFTLIVTAALLLIVPIVTVQAAGLAKNLPEYVAELTAVLTPYLQQLTDQIALAEFGSLGENAGKIAEGLLKWVGGATQAILNVFNVIALLVVTPVVAFYLLRDWDRIVARIDSWVPRDHLAEVRSQARAIDETLSGFLRGVGSVCLVLGIFYAVALTALGLQFGVLVGLIAGLLSFVPYLGAIGGFVLATVLAAIQFGDILYVGLAAGIFVAGQAIEGNFLTPKLVGDRVGLHPVWVIFALLAGGAVAGFVGVLTAVPVAATIGVLLRFAMGKYRESRLYLGDDRPRSGPQQ